jgi:hypothetical protein
MGADIKFLQLHFCVAESPSRTVATASEGLKAVQSLPPAVRSAVHWRLAEALLKLALEGQLDDHMLVRRMLLSAIEIDSQLRPINGHL